VAARRTLTNSDKEAWAAYASRIKPLSGREMPSVAAPALAVSAPVVPASPAPAPPVARKRHAVVIGEPPGDGLDKATWRRLRGGRLTPERTLDLHGMTAQRAFHALHALLVHAQAEQLRCVEVITGRGSGEGGGVIRRELPHWLNLPSLRPFVLAAVHPHPANPGATRILLRRSRK
jgi:DNA-nicking Smr family endonuclease